MPCVLFVVGAPGVGKTTALTGLLDPFGMALIQRPKWTLGDGVALVGHYGSGKFDGGDTIAYNGAAEALDYWLAHIYSDPTVHLTVLDGDRFSTSNCWRRVTGAVPRDQVRCVYLTCDQAGLEQRRASRNNKQNPSWMRGRATKAYNFSRHFDDDQLIEIDTTDLTPDEVTSRIKAAGGLS
jgi:hypothetical protein